MKEIGLQASGVTGEDDNQHEYNSTDELTPTQPLALDDESSLDSPPEPSWGYLETLTGYFDSFELRQAEFKFGRDPKGSSYFLQEARVPRGIWLALSRSHFSIEKNTDLSDLHSSEIILRDFSTYGTFVNGEKVGKGKWRPLVNCDIISICAVENRIFRFILFEVDDSEEEQEKAQLRSRLPKDLLNKYIVGKLLGHGTGGTVYLAYDKKRGMRKVAIKMAAITHANVREADILRKLTPHPCIIDIIEIFHTDTFIFMVLEYAKGGELFSYVVQDCKQDKFCERTSKLQFYQILSGVAHLHASRICHRDLKLENILLATRERTALVKITDFGLSKHHSNESMKSFVGTKMYMAPEVIKARNRLERYTDKADMWSCGCILYSILCGTHAFTAEDNKLLEESILSGKVVMDGEQWKKNISNEAKDLVLKLLETDSSRRISAPDALRHEWFAKDPQLVKMAVCLMKGMKLPEEEKIHMHQCYDRKRRRDEAEDLQEATRKQLRIN